MLAVVPFPPLPAAAAIVRRTPRLCLLFAVFAALAGCADRGSISDSESVYCLTQPNRARLAEAALALGLVSDRGSVPDQVRIDADDLTLERWRDAAPADFARTCRALAAAQPGTGGGNDLSPWIAAVFALLAAVVGAVGAGVVQAYLAGGARRRADARELRERAASFDTAAQAYLRGWQESEDALLRTADELLAAQEAMRQALDRIALERGSGALLDSVIEHLGGPPIRSGLDGWLGPADTRPDRLAALAEAMNYRLAAVRLAADAVERPGRRFVRLHRPAPRTVHGFRAGPA